MIVVGLLGGLGNQLFQYAAGSRLSLRLDTELRLDPTFLQRHDVPDLTYRPHLLDVFNIKGRLIEVEELIERNKKNDYGKYLERMLKDPIRR